MTTYALDPTGALAANLVENEAVTTVGTKYRLYMPAAGAFFSDSMAITDAVTGKPLTKDQFYITELAVLPTARYKKNISYGVIITDPGVAPGVARYQALGGAYAIMADALKMQFELCNLDNRPDAWPRIFKDSTNPVADILLPDSNDAKYGFEYLCEGIGQLAEEIVNGNAASHDDVWAYVLAVMKTIDSINNDPIAALAAHIANYNNPHNLTPEQIGTYSIKNVDENYGATVTAVKNHVVDYDNPHGETAAMLGLELAVDVDTVLSNAQKTTGVAVAAHIGKTDNPHGETAASIGAYTSAQIDNVFATLNSAVTVHAANTNNPHNDTPANIGTYSMSDFDAAWKAHTANVSNPHVVTPAQLGVYSQSEWASLLALKEDASAALTLDMFNTLWDTRLMQRFAFVYTIPNQKLALTISANTANYNIYDAAKAAGWGGTTPLDITLTINSGVWVYSTSPSLPALDTGTGWMAGTSIVIYNNGYIAGCGGAGGTGGYGSGASSGNTPVITAGSAGGAGGPAFNMQWSVILSNAGYILGGGGGGQGGTGASSFVATGTTKSGNEIGFVINYGGGGGGGGQGYNGGAGGGGGGVGASTGNSAGGNSGNAGSTSGPGTGGTGGSGSAVTPGGKGYTGGAWATAGSGAGGAAGKAVNVNGYSLSWTGTYGASTTYVKGAVS